MSYKTSDKYRKECEAFISGSEIPGVRIYYVSHDKLVEILGENARELNYGASRYAQDGTREIYLNKDADVGKIIGTFFHENGHFYFEYGNEAGSDEIAMTTLLDMSMDSTKPADLRMVAKYGLNGLEKINSLEKRFAQNAVKYLYEEGMN